MAWWLVGGGNLVCLLFFSLLCFLGRWLGFFVCFWGFVLLVFLKGINHDQDTSYQFRKLSLLLDAINVHQPIS